MDKFSLGFSISPIGPKTFQKLLSIYGSAEKAWNGSSPEKFKEAGVGDKVYAKFELFKNDFNFEKYIAKLKNSKVDFIPFSNKYYTKRLSKIDNPPIGLFVKGNKNILLEKEMLGVVGTRKVTSYGVQVTESLVTELVSRNIVIVSGMALGVDAIAHQSAIDGKGSTIAVLGCGVDCPFPRENEKLYYDIIHNSSLVISEYPLGMSPNRGTFPARNRIIAALSRGVLITEAAEDSGSLITADYALKQNKPVFAVPGQITSSLSRGSLKLLKQGAVMVSSSADIIDELGIKSGESNSGIKMFADLNLSKNEKMIMRILENESMTIDALSKIAKVPVSKLSVILSEMELSGFLINSGGGWKRV